MNGPSPTSTEMTSGTAPPGPIGIGGRRRGRLRGRLPDALGVDPSGFGEDGPVLDDDGPADDILTVVVSIAGRLVVGILGTVVLLAVTGSRWALGLGVLTWLVATAYFARRRTVQGAVSATGYAVAAVLALVPFVGLSPVTNAGSADRAGLFVVLLVVVAVPAAGAAIVGWMASRFVPDADGG